MAANTCTSKTGTVSGTDPNFKLVQNVRNRESGCYLYLKYTLESSGGLTLTLKTSNATGHLTSTDEYSLITLTGAAISGLTYTIAAGGNYRIPITLGPYDDSIAITIVAGSAAGSGVIVADILED